MSFDKGLTRFSPVRFHSVLLSAILTTVFLIGLFYLIVFAGYVPGWINPVLLGIAAVGIAFFYRGETGLEKHIVLFLAVILVTSLLSVDPFRSMAMAWRLSAGFVVFFFCAGLAYRGMTRERVIGCLLLTGGLVMVWSWVDAARWYGNWLAASPGKWLPDVGFRLNGSNNMAAYYNLLLMAAIPFIITAKKQVSRFGMILYALSAIGLIFLTTSRGGWFGTAAGFLVTAGFLFLKYRNTTRQTRPNPHRRLVLAGAAVLLFLVTAALIAFLAPVLLEHPTHGGLFLSARSHFWSVAWRMFLSSPVWGKGINTYASFFMQTYSHPPDGFFYHAHNQYLDILSGAGLAGVAAFGWLLIGIWRSFRASLERLGWRFDAVLAGAAAGLAAYLVHGVFDGLHRMPFASFTLCVLLGAALARRSEGEQGRGQIGPRVLAAGVAAAAACFGLWNAWRLVPYQQAVQAAGEGNLARAAALFETAAERAPGLAMAYQQEGLVYAALAEGGEPGALDKAIGAFERAGQLDPYWGLNAANLGALYRARGEMEKAEAAFQQAADLAPRSALYWLNLGTAQEEQGKTEQARVSYLRALELEPRYAPAYFWRSSALREETGAQVEANGDEEQVSQAELLERIRTQQASAYVYVLVAEYQNQAGQPAAALQTIKIARMAFADSYDFKVRMEMDWQEAAALATGGELERAAALGERILFDLQHPGSYGPGSRGRVFYSEEFFGLPAMEEDLAPQLSTIGLTDRWGERMMLLARWQAELGAVERAGEIEAVIREGIPDFGEVVGEERAVGVE